MREEQERPFREPAGPEPASVAEVLGRITGRRGWSARLQGARIHEAWQRVAGPALAAHVTPVRLAGGVLVLRASSQAWATQVRFLSADLAAAAERELGEGTVRQVTVVVGPAPNASDRQR